MAASNKVGKTILGTKLGDKLTGTAYDDIISSGLGNDILRGAGGNDTLTGGGGKDTFVFEKDRNTNGLDTILDLIPQNRSSGESDLLDLSLAVTAKNISNNTIGSYVWVINEKLYVDASGGGITGGKGVVWANLPGVSGGEKLNIRTLSYDGPLEVTRFEAPALKLSNDTGSSGSDRITQDPRIAVPGNTVGTVYYSLDGMNWSTTYVPPTEDGTYTLYSKQVHDGIESKQSSMTFTLDTTADADDNLGVSFDDDTVADADKGSITLSVTGVDDDIDPAGVTIVVTDKDGNTATAVYDPGSGKWLVDGTLLVTGALTAELTVIDAAGNQGTAQATGTLLPGDILRPNVLGVALTAEDELTYAVLNAGDKVTVTVTMDEATAVDTTGGTPRIGLKIGDTNVYAVYASGSGGTELTFEYLLQEGENDADGISIGADSLEANGATLKDAIGNAAVLTHAEVADDPGFKVDTVDPLATLATAISSGTPMATYLGALDHPTNPNGRDYAPNALSLNDKGDFVVTWLGTNVDGSTTGFVQRFFADGTRDGALMQLPGVTNTNAPTLHALGDTGKYAVAWTTLNGASTKSSVTLQIFEADGSTTAPLVTLDGPNAASDLTDADPRIVSLGSNGDFVVSWSGTNSANFGDASVFVQRIGADGGLIGGVTQLDGHPTDTAKDDGAARVAALGTDGSYVITWYGVDDTGTGNDYSVFVQKFNPDGSTAGAQQLLESLYTYPSNQDGRPEMSPMVTAVGGDGAFVVAWSGGSTPVLGSIFPDNTDHAVYVQKFGANGLPDGAVQRLDGIASAAMDSLLDVQAVGSSGMYAVAWKGDNATGLFVSDNSVYVQLFDAAGTPTLVNPVKLDVDASTTGADWPARILPIGTSGEFVVYWQGIGADMGSATVMLQKFKADGTLDGAPLRFDAPDAPAAGGYDSAAFLTALGGNGDLLLTWQGQSAARDYSIYISKVTGWGAVPGELTASSNEGGKLYLVDSSATVTNESDILALADDRFNALPHTAANSPTPVDTTGLADGTYKLFAVDLAGNLGVADHTLTVGEPLADDWADGYDDFNSSGGSMPYGPLSLDGKTPAVGVIEVAGDTDAFDPGVLWRNGVYEITVSGDLTSDDLRLDLLDTRVPYDQSLSEDPSALCVFEAVNGSFFLSLNGNDVLVPYSTFDPGFWGLLSVGGANGATGTYDLAVRLVDDYTDDIDLDYAKDLTPDLGFGSIQKTDVSGIGKQVTGLVNEVGDVDFWKYLGTAGETVGLRLQSPDSVQGWGWTAADPSELGVHLYDSTHTEISANSDGIYTLDGTTYVQIVGLAAAEGSTYMLEVFAPTA